MHGQDADDDRLRQEALERFFGTLIEIGEIEVADRGPADIYEEYLDILARFAYSDADVLQIIDHREDLLDRARKEAGAENNNLAITFYAIWFEHSINRMLVDALKRAGHGREAGIQLIKELRLPTKATALWAIAGLPAINEEGLKLLGRIAEFRNVFVHYKWKAYAEPVLYQQNEQLGDVVTQAESLVSELLAIESQFFWNGRSQELLDYFRKHW